MCKAKYSNSVYHLIYEVVVADGQAGGQNHEEAEGDGHDGQRPRPPGEDLGGGVEAVLGFIKLS